MIFEYYAQWKKSTRGVISERLHQIRWYRDTSRVIIRCHIFHGSYIIHICKSSAFHFSWWLNVIFYQSTSKKTEHLLGLSLHAVRTRRNDNLQYYSIYLRALVAVVEVAGNARYNRIQLYRSLKKVNFSLTQTPAYILRT